MFEWDNNKAQRNLEKHGIDFYEAVTGFDDGEIFLYHDLPHSGTEDRYFAIANTAHHRVIAMVFTVRRNKNGEKIYRIISARYASQKERKIYFRQED
ncbi:MAG: BrnT family toxin [Deltaproteobacteria bacterium]